jgi:hypothetical protein
LIVQVQQVLLVNPQGAALLEVEMVANASTVAVARIRERL